jgi:hypothetical protein
MIPTIEYIVKTERELLRSDGEPVLFMGELPAPHEGPFWVSNARGSIVSTRPTSSGYVRYGYSPVDSDNRMLLSLLGLPDLPRAGALTEAMGRLSSNGEKPLVVVANAKPDRALPAGLHVFIVPTVPHHVLLASPAQVGYGHRSGDYFGMVLFNPQKTLVGFDTFE